MRRQKQTKKPVRTPTVSRDFSWPGGGNLEISGIPETGGGHDHIRHFQTRMSSGEGGPHPYPEEQIQN